MNNKTPLQKQKNLIKEIMFCIIIVVITFIAFSPSLNNDFTNWDDNVYVTENPDIKSFSFHNLSKVFLSEYEGNYQPLTMLTYMVDYQFSHLNPVTYHATNLIIHIVNALLVFALFYIVLKNPLVSLFCALLFAIHPLRVESVAWVAERKDVLCGLFYFLSLLFYILFVKKGSSRYYWLCALSFVLSLLSKPMAVSLPVVLLCIDYLNSRKINKKLLIEKVPFVVLSVLFALITILTQKLPESNPGFIAISMSMIQRICVPFYGIIFYIIKSIIPVNLCAYYPFPSEHDFVMNIQLFAAPIFVIGSAIALYLFRTRSRMFVFGALFFLIVSLPILQILPVGGTIVAERYMYIPCIGIFCMIAAIYLDLFKNKLSIFAKRAFVSVIIVFITTISFITFTRCNVWKNSLTLWTDCINRYPNAVACNNRGIAFGQVGDYRRAMDDFNSSITINPEYALAYFNRGILYRKLGDYDHAIEDNTRAIQLCSRYTLAYYYRGITYCFKGDFDRGIEDLTQTVALDPQNGEAFYNRGLAYEQKKNYPGAAQDYKQACMLGYSFACQFAK